MTLFSSYITHDALEGVRFHGAMMGRPPCMTDARYKAYTRYKAYIRSSYKEFPLWAPNIVVARSIRMPDASITEDYYVSRAHTFVLQFWG